MPAPFEEAADRQAYVADLGEEVSYTPFGGAAKTINGIFEKESDRFPLANGEGFVIGYEPGIECVTADLTGTPLSGSIVADGTTYTIMEVAPDGTGMTHLRLKEA